MQDDESEMQDRGSKALKRNTIQDLNAMSQKREKSRERKDW
jgi:hypothetical protein